MAQLKDLLVNGAARVVGSLFADLSGNVLNFGICSTAAGTAAKTVTTGGTFELIEGSKVLVLFQNTDTSNAPTLNVNGTGAKSIKVNASDGVPKGFLTAHQYYWFAYDGSAWRIAGGGATQIAPIQYGGTNNDSFTANRPLFFNGTKIIGSTTNYINDTQLGINETSVTSGMNFEVNGKSNFKDLITGTRLLLTSTADADGASANAVALLIGDQTGQHLEFDTNEIMSKSDGTTPSTLYVQYNEGGYTRFGRGGIGIDGTNTDYKLYVVGSTYFLSGISYFGLGSNDQKYYIDTANNNTTSGNAELRDVNVHALGIRTHAGAGEGISLQGGYVNNDFPDFGLAYADTGNGSKYGDVQGDWATYFLLKQESNPQRGWIWRGRDMSAASDIAGSLSSRGVFTTRAVAANDTYIAFPQGGTFNQANDVTGMLIIKLPQIKTNTLLRFDVEIYTFSTSKKTLATYHIGGQLRNDDNLWSNSQVYSEGIGNLSNLTVRFGYTADDAYILIGELDTLWSYPKVAITNIVMGHSNATVEKWAYGWQVSIADTNPCTGNSYTESSPKIQSEYIGMNLLLGTQYMDEWTGDNIVTNLPQTYCRGKKVSIGSSAAAADKDIKSTNAITLPSYSWYVLSFYAKASKSITLSTFLGTVSYAYNNASVITANTSTGQVQHQLTTSWKRYYVVFKTASTIERTITVLRLPSDELDTTVTVCLPKLEKGFVPTDWSRNPADAVHLFGASGDTSYLYNGGGYSAAYNNLILHGTSPNGVSGIAFTSQTGLTTINSPSDRAFIQYHPHGITTAVAENHEPTEATTGETGRFVIGIGNDVETEEYEADQLWLQVPDVLGLKHQIGANSYTIADTHNTNWTTWNNGTTAGPTLSINFAGVVKTSPAIPKASSSISGIVTTDAQTFGGDKTFTGHIYANTNSSQDIGSSSNIFRNIYGTTIYGTLNNAVTFERNGTTVGSFDNSASVTYDFGNVVQDLTGSDEGTVNGINADTFDGMTKQQWLNTIYPIGSIYMSVSATSPATLFGGTWESLGGRFLIGQDGTYTPGSTGGSATHTHTIAHTHTYAHTHTTPATTTGNHTLTQAETPAHTHTRGTMNITGQGSSIGHTGNVSYGLNMDGSNWSGAFYSFASTNCYAMPTSGTLYNNSQHHSGVAFNASRSWSGATSSIGGGGAHNHPQVATTTNSQSASTTSAASNANSGSTSALPPYLSVYMWKRTA